MIRFRQCPSGIWSTALGLLAFALCALSGVPQVQNSLQMGVFDSVFGKIGALTVVLGASLWWMWLAASLGNRLRFLSAKFQIALPQWLTFIIGISLVGMIAAIAAHLQLLCRPFFVILTIAVGLTSPQWSIPEVNPIRRWRPWDLLVGGALVYFALPKWIESMVPSGQGDPLYYHIYSAWLWSTHGGFYFDGWFPQFFQGGVIEYMYACLGTLVQDPLATLVSAQVLHATVSIFLSGIVIYQLAKMVLKDRLLALLAVLAFLLIPHDPFTVVRAKNDGFVALFVLTSMWCFLSFVQTQQKRWWVLMCFFAATSLTVKHTALFALMPLSILALVEVYIQRKRPEFLWLIVAAGALLPWSVVMLVRNTVLTDSPFFPALTNLFPSPYMNDRMAQIISGYVGNRPNVFMEFVHAVESYGYLRLFFFLWILGGFFIRKKSEIYLYLLTGGTLAVTAKMSGANPISDRFALAALGLMAVSSAWTMQKILMYSVRKVEWVQPCTALIALALILPNSGIELPMSRLFKVNVPALVSPHSLIKPLADGRDMVRMTMWIRDSSLSGRILSDNTGEGLFARLPVIHSDWEVRANDTMNAQTIEDFARLMRQSDFNLFLQVRPDLPEGKHPLWDVDRSKVMDLIHVEGNYLLYKMKT